MVTWQWGALSGREMGKDSLGRRATSGRLAFSSSPQHSLSFLAFLSPDTLQLRASNPPLGEPVHRESLWFFSAGLAAPPPPPRSSGRPGGPPPARICTTSLASIPLLPRAAGATPPCVWGVACRFAPSPHPQCLLCQLPEKSWEQYPASHLKNISCDSSQASHSTSRPISFFRRLPDGPASPHTSSFLSRELLCFSDCGPPLRPCPEGLETGCDCLPPAPTWMPAPSGTMIFHTQLRLLR